MEFESTFINFFSLIPQLLAAMISLLAVFVFFKFQSITTSVAAIGQHFLNKLDHEPVFQRIDDRLLSIYKKELRESSVRQDLATSFSHVGAIFLRLTEIHEDTKFLHNDDIIPSIEKVRIMKNLQALAGIQGRVVELKEILNDRIREIFFYGFSLMLFSLACIFIVHPLIKADAIYLLFVIMLWIFAWFSVCLYDMVRIVLISLARDYDSRTDIEFGTDREGNKIDWRKEFKSIFIPGKVVKWKHLDEYPVNFDKPNS